MTVTCKNESFGDCVCVRVCVTRGNRKREREKHVRYEHNDSTLVLCLSVFHDLHGALCNRDRRFAVVSRMLRLLLFVANKRYMPKEERGHQSDGGAHWIMLPDGFIVLIALLVKVAKESLHKLASDHHRLHHYPTPTSAQKLVEDLCGLCSATK